jgi:hypothetical protein
MLRSLVATAHVWLTLARIWLLRATLDRASGRKDGAARPIVEQIRGEVLGWPGVVEHPHRFGGIEFRLGRIELGHLHGDYLADLPFPVRVREQLVREGKAMPHHILPLSGWVSYPIRDAAAVPSALALFRLAYDRAIARRDRQPAVADGSAAESGDDQHDAGD